MFARMFGSTGGVYWRFLLLDVLFWCEISKIDDEISNLGENRLHDSRYDVAAARNATLCCVKSRSETSNSTSE